MFTTVQAVLTQYQNTWAVLPAFVEAAGELDAAIEQIGIEAQTQNDHPGAAAEKKQTLAALVQSAHEIGAAHAWGLAKRSRKGVGSWFWQVALFLDGR